MRAALFALFLLRALGALAVLGAVAQRVELAVALLGLLALGAALLAAVAALLTFGALAVLGAVAQRVARNASGLRARSSTSKTRYFSQGNILEMKRVDLEESFRIIEATEQSLDDFIPLLEQTGVWLWEKGIKQWPPGIFQENRAKLAHYVENGCLILAYLSGQLAGGCILSTVIPDWPDFPDNAMYLNSLVVARFAAGIGLGMKIINECAASARKRGRQYIYLDCWDGNDF